jgi:predicted dinucleotide-binding enzyme
MGKPKGEKIRVALVVSDDDSKSKEVVFMLAEELGFDSLTRVILVTHGRSNQILLFIAGKSVL